MAMDAEMKELLEGLPGSLDALLAHPARRRPAVIERLLDRAEALRREDPERAAAVAEAGKSLTARFPAFFPRAERYRLRARALEVWGSLQRDLGDQVAAEGAFLTAFELANQPGRRSPAQLAALLGRRALLAGDQGDLMKLGYYVKAAIRLADDANRGWPFQTLAPLCEAVVSERRSVLPAGWLTLALVCYTNMVAKDGTILPPNLAMEVEPLGEVGFDFYIRRNIPALRSGLPWKLSARIKLYNQENCDIHLHREVPERPPLDGWALEEVRAWKVRAPRRRRASLAEVVPLPVRGSRPS